MALLRYETTHCPHHDLRLQPGPSGCEHGRDPLARPFAILYTNSEEEAFSFMAVHGFSSYPVIGLDTESKPVFSRGQTAVVALLQLAVPHAVLVVQLNALRLASPSSPASGCIGRFFADPSRRFSGMGVGQDIAMLARTSMGAAVFPKGPEGGGLSAGIDLKAYGSKRGVNEKGGLAALTAHCAPSLGVWKSKTLQMSNWAAYPLSPPQIRYAACDAWASLLAYNVLSTYPLSGGGGGAGMGAPDATASGGGFFSGAAAQAVPCGPTLHSVRHDVAQRGEGGGGRAGTPSGWRGAPAVAPRSASGSSMPAGRSSPTPHSPPKLERLTMDEFREEVLHLYGPTFRSSVRWVSAARIGTDIPRSAWPYDDRGVPFGNLRRLAAASGMRVRSPDSELGAGPMWVTLDP
jgi:ribonuclease D